MSAFESCAGGEALRFSEWMDALRRFSRTRAARAEAAERLRASLELQAQRYDAVAGGGGGEGLESLVEAEAQDAEEAARWRRAEAVAMQAIWRDARSVAMVCGPAEAWACHSVYVYDEEPREVARDLGLAPEALAAMLAGVCRRMDAEGWRLPQMFG
jgi:hypothetical protein